MNYLLDKKNKKKKISRALFLIIFLLLIFLFRNSLSRVVSSSLHWLTKPILFLGNNLVTGAHHLDDYFSFKRNIVLENEVLKLQIKENEAKVANYNTLLTENQEIKEILNRKIINDFILGVILAKPNRSLYDTLVIDIGQKDGILSNQKVFAYGNIPIGYVGEVYENSSKVILYSSPGEKTDVIVSGKDIFIQMIGRGAGNFEVILPRNVSLEVGNEIVLPGVNPYLVAEVTKVISNPHDSYQKILLLSPVNIFELKFVEVEK